MYFTRTDMLHLCQKQKVLGIDGLILPDMSIEESKEYLKSAKKNNLDTIFLVSPNTKNDQT